MAPMAGPDGEGRGDTSAALRSAGRPRWNESPYSWLPGTGSNLIPRNATPTGAEVDASMVIAVQMILMDVAAMAVVP
jgi:hypothetical protein